MNYQYDIECCAPTLIHQYAQQCGMDLYLFALRRYLRDRTDVRNELSKEIGITTAEVKQIVNALFAGASLGHNPESHIYKMLNGNYAKIQTLKDNKYIQELRDDIKICWEYIRPFTYTDVKTNPVTGKSRRQPMMSKQKWGIYFQQERKVLEAVRHYCKLTDNKFFTEHDGWTTEHPHDIVDLCDYIEYHTNFKIKIECEVLH